MAKEWLELTTLPAGHLTNGAGFGVWGNKLVAIGGADTQGLSGLVSVYDPSADTWTELTTLAQGINMNYDPVVVISDVAYYRAGSNLRSINLLTLEEDSVSMPSGSFNLTSFVTAGGLLYAFGTHAWTQQRVYDPTTNTWAALPAPPVSFAYPGAAVGSDGRIYVKALTSFSNGDPWFGAYDPTLETWEVLEPDSVPQARTNGALLGDQLVFVGGVGDIWHEARAYDPTLDEWDTAAPDLEGIEVGNAHTLTIDGATTLVAVGRNIANPRPVRIMAFMEPPEPIPEPDPISEWDELATLTGHPAKYAAAGMVEGRLWVIGGADSNFDPVPNVSSYDPATGAWATEAPLSTPVAPGTNTLASIGPVAYFVSEDSFYGLDTDNGLLTILTPPAGATAGFPLIEHEGFIYWMGPTPQAYAPQFDVWAPLAEPPLTPGSGASAVIDRTTRRIYVQDGISFAAYDIRADAWLARSNNPVGPANAGAFIERGFTTIAGGLTFGPNLTVTRHNPQTNTWDVLDNLPQGMLNATAHTLPEGPDTRVLLFSGETGALLTLLREGQDPPPEPDPEPEPVVADLTILVSVELPVATSDAFLTMHVDVTGGPGVSADLLVAFTTGRGVTAAAIATVDVPTAPQFGWDPPAASTPAGVTPAIPTRALSTDEATVFPVMLGADQYDISWREGAQQTGTVTSYGPDSNPLPEDGFALEGAPSASIDWGAEPPTTRTHTYAQPTTELASSEALPELMPVSALPTSPDLVTGCLRPHHVTLCEAQAVAVRCATFELLPMVLPTRLELATAAAHALGLELVILNGVTGLVNPTGVVSEDYRTEGKTLAQVLDDLLLGGAAPHWYAPGLVLVHGGGLPTGALTPPAARGTGGNVTTQPGAAFDQPEPELADYLADCRDDTSAPGDPCGQETFETAYSGSLTWVERGGSGINYQEVETTLVKEAGRIVREEVTVRRAVWTPNTNVTSPFSGGGSVVIAPVEWTLREHTYLACCPTALSHSLERTWVLPSNTDPSAEYQTAPGAYLSTLKEVTQTWHAEGWLRARLEATQQHHGWHLAGGTFGTDDITLTPSYKVTTRSEQYAPVGRGLWHVSTRVADSVLMSVGETPSDPTGAHWGEVVNTYTLVTDQAPAQVTCDEPGRNPCREGDCAAQREEDYERDHAEWEALRDAWLANNPAELVSTSVTYSGRHHLLPGSVTELGLIVGVSWSGAGDRTDTPGESTTVEYRAGAP